MKCPKTRPPLRSVSGKELRPERSCPDDLYDIRPDGFASCPYHGLVEWGEDDLTGKQQEIMDRIVAEANGKKKRKGKKAKKDKRRG